MALSACLCVFHRPLRLSDQRCSSSAHRTARSHRQPATKPNPPYSAPYLVTPNSDMGCTYLRAVAASTAEAEHEYHSCGTHWSVAFNCSPGRPIISVSPLDALHPYLKTED